MKIEQISDAPTTYEIYDLAQYYYAINPFKTRLIQYHYVKRNSSWICLQRNLHKPAEVEYCAIRIERIPWKYTSCSLIRFCVFENLTAFRR